MNLLSIDDWIFQLEMYAKSDSFVAPLLGFFLFTFFNNHTKTSKWCTKKVWNKLSIAWKFASRFQFYTASLPLKQFQRKLHWIILEEKCSFVLYEFFVIETGFYHGGLISISCWAQSKFYWLPSSHFPFLNSSPNVHQFD